jgi:hypothetical protein
MNETDESFDISWPKLGLGIILGYAVSWVYFFLTLPILMKLLGKINGTIINYGLSWLIWILVTYATHSFDLDDDSNF